MSLPAADPGRQLKHRRTFDVQIFARGNGLWEVDARITDVKPHDVELGGAPRRAGDPVHDMRVRLVIDEAMNVLEAGSEMVWMPYPGACDGHGDPYAQLVGLNLRSGFREAVRRRVGGTRGCTHITELTQVLPTAVIQAFAGDVFNTDDDPRNDIRPFQLDRCHALRLDQQAVRVHYPRWYRPASSEQADTRTADPSTEPQQESQR